MIIKEPKNNEQYVVEQLNQDNTTENGVIYIMLCCGYYKIGKAKIGSTRFGEYTHLQQKPIYLYKKICSDYHNLEYSIHEKYSAYNTNGEWYRFDSDILEEIINYIDQFSISEYYSSGTNDKTHENNTDIRYDKQIYQKYDKLIEKYVALEDEYKKYKEKIIESLGSNPDLAFLLDSYMKEITIKRCREGKEMAKKDPNFKEGRPPKYSDEEISIALHLLEENSYKKVEKITGISKTTLVRAKRKYKENVLNVEN